MILERRYTVETDGMGGHLSAQLVSQRGPRADQILACSSQRPECLGLIRIGLQHPGIRLDLRNLSAIPSQVGPTPQTPGWPVHRTSTSTSTMDVEAISGKDATLDASLIAPDQRYTRPGSQAIASAAPLRFARHHEGLIRLPRAPSEMAGPTRRRLPGPCRRRLSPRHAPRARPRSGHETPGGCRVRCRRPRTVRSRG